MAEITTVIPVYNGEKHIRDTLDCLAGQTRRPDRVIVVDDKSTDRTEEIVRTFAGIKCDWVPNERNLGLFGNHNSALRFTQETRFFHILHANDTVSLDFFQKLIPLIENAPGFALAYGGHAFMTEEGVVTETHPAAFGTAPRKLSLGEFLTRQSELQAIQLHSAVMKTEFKPSPVQFRLDLPQLGDVVFHSAFATHCSEIWTHPAILSQVRVHADSMTNRNMRKINAWVLDEWTAMQFVYDLMARNGVGSFARKEKLKLLFAARCHAKMNLMRRLDPSYARQIRDSVRPIVGGSRWSAAGMVVRLRDIFAPKNDQARQRVEQTKNQV